MRIPEQCKEIFWFEGGAGANCVLDRFHGGLHIHGNITWGTIEKACNTMKMYVWRNGWLGALDVALADSKEQAIELLKSCSNVTDDTFNLEFANEPEIFDIPKAFVVWADVYDIDETTCPKK